MTTEISMQWKSKLISLLLALLVFCLAGKTQGADSEGTFKAKEPSVPIFNLCQHEITDYSSLKAKIEKKYPIGSDVSVLLSDASRIFGKPVSEKKVTDFLFITNKNEVSKNSWFYSFSKRCDYSSVYSVDWDIHILADLTKKITAINIRPIIQTNDFSLIHVPFNFEYFYNAKGSQKALWHLTGTGTPKNEILKLMAEINGEYGDLETIKIKNLGERLGYRYQYKPKTFIASRIAPWSFSHIVIWEFDEQDELTKLIVR